MAELALSRPRLHNSRLLDAAVAFDAPVGVIQRKRHAADHAATDALRNRYRGMINRHHLKRATHIRILHEAEHNHKSNHPA